MKAQFDHGALLPISIAKFHLGMASLYGLRFLARSLRSSFRKASIHMSVYGRAGYFCWPQGLIVGFGGMLRQNYGLEPIFHQF